MGAALEQLDHGQLLWLVRRSDLRVSGNPATGRWTCWGGGWYINWANGDIPRNLICNRCRLATYNQNLRIGQSVRSGAHNSVFGYHRSYGIFIEGAARQPVNVNNRVWHY